MHNTYDQAINKLKDHTRPKVCVNLTSKFRSEDITTQLPTNNHTIIVHYIWKGQPYVHAIFGGEDSKTTNEIKITLLQIIFILLKN